MATASSGTARKGRARRPPRVSVLRVGHRLGRDPRLTTHLALTARALGAERMHLHPPDPAVVQTLSKVRESWGGDFEVTSAPRWRDVLRQHEGDVVHLTMYGLPLEKLLPSLRRSRHLLVVVGGAKVPSDLYRKAQYNLAVGDQPHSEVAALAVTLVALRGLPRRRTWRGARLRIVPSARGKKVMVPPPRPRSGEGP